MNEQNLAAVVLAAGKGTRMRSGRSKVLHPVAGRPMVRYPVELARSLGCDPAVLVVGHGAEEVQSALAGEDVRFALQAEQLGTGHALLCAEQALDGFAGTLLLLCGDVPLLRRQTLERLLAYHRSQGAAVTVLTAEVPEPHGYGRIVRDGDQVLRIVEEKDATPKEKTIHEINTGIYAFEAPRVFDALRRVGSDNAQGEYYLTDVLEVTRSAGEAVRALAAADAVEIMGINDRVQLARADRLMRRRINEELMRGGVTIVDPEATYIEAGVEIGRDTIVHPGAHLRGATRIGRFCEIDPGAVVTDCVLGDEVHIKAGSVLSESQIGAGTDIGPMAHLRPGTVLTGGNKIGNFVETKKAVIGEGSKASHLTYIGDAEVGADVNIGCGTITCNYDGVAKHKTVIEDGVFVGSDTQFVAPVRIGRGSLIGAGSTITKDVPPDSLALSRAEQKIIEGWALRKKKSGKSKTTK
ncbi:bifunctional UDP-N-acetylglucosamine diphosphorylase/glucosamine-1-phosphate N-acetyltransferase GlmU [uncultured Desulfuromonas sp.]|uniref:bifunctional UDP-N-acetylglucosamine diphosphorylase/glucosamine-1-phosphate N-acetyltransferase GlmU n=1 Tax=uncultured Desulfuromonas sp. TaxID=181013 RepID=UPI00261788A8|nr:bifunctional UDP-N-acetylglucosamine diphosphorylase/glucosamine-1-phosphate N-acetyltransferase GlmU [uncultured Desulfuromonas sp.]